MEVPMISSTAEWQCNSLGGGKGRTSREERFGLGRGIELVAGSASISCALSVLAA